MAYLNDRQYLGIVAQTNMYKNAEDVSDFFRVEYLSQKNDNPKFIEKLKEAIERIEKGIDEKRNELIRRDERDNYKNPDGTPMEKKDYKNMEITLGNLNGLRTFTQFDGWYLSKTKIETTLQGFELFREKMTDAEDVIIIPEQENPELIPEGQKLIWKGTPGQFAFIVDLLINKGYLEKPSQFAERNAGIFLELFEFAEHNPTKESLGKLLHKEQDAIKNPEHKGKFLKIPHRNELDK